ncbi:MAG: CPBP family intramembrane metalloprotease [Chloroflexales bacterium]|nr:CPBP family intramembrane metalloprotease [Chloroflexales bacterium]
MTLFWRILRFPIVKLIAFLIILAILVIIQSAISEYVELGNTASSLGHLGATLFAIMPFVLAYVVLVKVIEQRPLSEFASTTVWGGLAQGMLLGGAMMSALVVVMVLTGVYHIKGWQDIPWQDIIDVGIWAGIVEEILLRGVVLRMLEELFGSWAAILLSGLIFGFLHAGNPNADWWSSTAIAIEAGLLFGVLFCLTRSLWVVIGLHAAWNIAQGPIYGVTVSGITQHGIINAQIDGPWWLTGGSFGLEAALTSVVLSLIITGYFGYRLAQSNKVVGPWWRRTLFIPNQPLPPHP